MRVVGFLNAVTGQVHAWDFSKVTAPRLRQSWLQAAKAYPFAKKIYLVIDNWPVHFHATALEALVQDPRIELVLLPTYSPWLNAIEKLWRWVRQRVTHAHPWSDDFQEFKRQIMSELLVYQEGSESLLRYVGLFS